MVKVKRGIQWQSEIKMFVVYSLFCFFTTESVVFYKIKLESYKNYEFRNKSNLQQTLFFTTLSRFTLFYYWKFLWKAEYLMKLHISVLWAAVNLLVPSECASSSHNHDHSKQPHQEIACSSSQKSYVGSIVSDKDRSGSLKEPGP